MTEEEQQQEKDAYERYVIENALSPYEIEKHGINDYKIIKNENLPIHPDFDRLIIAEKEKNVDNS